jgi:hypothetical protein
MSERQGVEIDYCPTCRGVWLDRGELDKIIERSARYEAQAAQGAPPPTPPPAAAPPPPNPQDPYGARPHVVTVPVGGHPSPYKGYGYRRRKGFLGELFDF